MWTCIECDGNYDDTTGDTDERTCNDCMDKDSFVPIEGTKRGLVAGYKPNRLSLYGDRR